MKKQIELLAPAGSMESFYAAVNTEQIQCILRKCIQRRQNSQNFVNEEMNI